MAWKPYEGILKPRGIREEGDPRVPKTRWWNHWYLVWRGWKVVVLFRVPEEWTRRGYFIGFIPFQGPPQYLDQRIHDEEFAVKIGRESCTFFAIGYDDGEIVPDEVPLTRSGRMRLRYIGEHIPIY
ncbi:MAG: hypothetical protein A3C88_00005 [Candidatus Yanofskybacteria bacterium RIFCSPHIGHO2_02_FULL_50_12]|uniref:Uncharacterized protein n=1 Tax=Candidatus Yanofskybacteria bacterium RIFCSPHIGHO2_02_FULL_50_12 TaxID=1802685 RepID=A0A1F8FU89_9BACT|nr:MAG: hypothetical protein A3C88_00005 [Candidatus Yanofskybacteria bacterium RIFCSPHIGHO2_02_FULL_50_12]